MDVHGNSAHEANPTIRAVPVRIGDAERDRAVTALGEHFAAGRLNREELDERVDQAITARFDADLTPLFVDLPAAPVVVAAAPAAPAVRSTRTAAAVPAAAALIWGLLPLVMVAIVTTAVLAGAPWLLWSLFWVVAISGGGRRFVVVRQAQHPHR